MDPLPVTSTELSYDDNVAYEAQLPTEAERAASLAARIGTNKVYLLADSAVSSNRKRKARDDEQDEMDEDDELNLGPSYRQNAILLNGSPIAHLPTTRLFAYAEHYKVRPMGLEWVDDSNCVLVFESRKDARDAFVRLQKTTPQEPDMDELLAARLFPVALWPPDERISSTIGKSEGLKGPIRMRWARVDDVKKKNAMHLSKFYERHGVSAGKELFDGRDLPPAKRVRHEDRETTDAVRRAQLDDELDEFLAQSDTDKDMEEQEEVPVELLEDLPPSAPSKMRSDYIAGNGRSLLDRTSLLRLVSDDRPDLESRLTAPLPRRRGRNGERALESLGDRLAATSSSKLEWGPTPERRERGGRGSRREREDGRRDDRRSKNTERPGRTATRPRKTQQELDDELDAFLNGG